MTDDLVVATERLGWPLAPRGLARLLPWESQDRFRYDDQPDTPTATCHLQADEERPALCGCPWELLIRVPGDPAWSGLEEWQRCDECAAVRDDEGACRGCWHPWSEHIPPDPCSECRYEIDHGVWGTPAAPCIRTALP